MGYTPRSEDGLSPSHSSDYEDQEEFDNISQQIATVHMVSTIRLHKVWDCRTFLLQPLSTFQNNYLQSNDGRVAGVAGLVGRVRGLRQDVQRKITRLRNENTEQQRRNEQAFACSASSVESLPSGSGSSK